jgi:hypothetical protein
MLTGCVAHEVTDVPFSPQGDGNAAVRSDGWGIVTFAGHPLAFAAIRGEASDDILAVGCDGQPLRRSILLMPNAPRGYSTVDQKVTFSFDDGTAVATVLKSSPELRMNPDLELFDDQPGVALALTQLQMGEHVETTVAEAHGQVLHARFSLTGAAQTIQQASGGCAQ